MAWLKTALQELFGLFVDDLPFTIAIAVWLALASLLLPALVSDTRWDGALLFLGCALILVESVNRAARRSGAQAKRPA
jgi:hypothetical protein